MHCITIQITLKIEVQQANAILCRPVEYKSILNRIQQPIKKSRIAQHSKHRIATTL